MSIDPLGILPIDQRPAPGQRAAKDSGSGVIGKDGFLKLLVSQLSNQDPLNPMEGQEFAAQLAQFSSVEALLNIDETLTGQGELNALLAQSMNNGVAAGLIGRSVEAPGNQLSWDGRAAATGMFDLKGTADSVKVEILDTSGAVVRTIDLGAMASGKHEFSWDGAADGGVSQQAGAYAARVVATDKNGKSIESTSTIKGKVDRVTFSNDGVFLWIGQVKISMAQVQTVYDSN